MTGDKILEHAEAAFVDAARSHVYGNEQRLMQIVEAAREQVYELLKGAGITNTKQLLAPDTLHNLAGGLRDRAEIFRQLGKDDGRFYLADGLAALAEQLSRTQ